MTFRYLARYCKQKLDFSAETFKPVYTQFFELGVRGALLPNVH